MLNAKWYKMKIKILKKHVFVGVLKKTKNWESKQIS